MFKEPLFLGGDFVGKSKGFEIIIASHYGMCFGVRDAITPEEKRAKSAELTILGELVHNKVVREKMRSLGIREGDLFGTRAPTREVLVTAHEASGQEKLRWGKWLTTSGTRLVHWFGKLITHWLVRWPEDIFQW